VRQPVGVLEAQKFWATDWELAQFVRCCRRMKHLNEKLVGTLNSLAQKQEHELVRAAAGHPHPQVFNLVREIRRLGTILSTEWDEEVRRAILPRLCLLPPGRGRRARAASRGTDFWSALYNVHCQIDSDRRH